MYYKILKIRVQHKLFLYGITCVCCVWGHHEKTKIYIDKYFFDWQRDEKPNILKKTNKIINPFRQSS